MRLHIICGALLIGFCAYAQQKQPAEKQQTVKLKLPPLPPNTEAYLTAQLADARWTPAEKGESKLPPGSELARRRISWRAAPSSSSCSSPAARSRSAWISASRVCNCA